MLFVALGFGSGLVPRAPGTFGTLAAIPLYLLFFYLPWWAQLFIVSVAFAVGVYCCQQAAATLGEHDNPAIVWDEFVGLWLTLLALPLANTTLTPGYLLAAFVLFRCFDILKPWPIRWADKRVSGGLGIMLDDVLAGIYAGLGLWVLLWLTGNWLTGN